MAVAGATTPHRLLVVRIETHHFRLHATLRLAEHRQAEDTQRQSELREHGGDDEYLPERVQRPDPDDGEVQQRPIDVAENQLVDSHRDEREPRDPESGDQREGHRMTGIGQVLGQSGGVLLIVDGFAGAQFPDHHEDVAEVVHDRDDGRAEDENGQGGTVGGHVAPVQFANACFLVEDRVAVAEQRWTAQQRRRDPGECHPALTPKLPTKQNQEIFFQLFRK